MAAQVAITHRRFQPGMTTDWQANRLTPISWEKNQARVVRSGLELQWTLRQPSGTLEHHSSTQGNCILVNARLINIERPQFIGIASQGTRASRVDICMRQSGRIREGCRLPTHLGLETR